MTILCIEKQIRQYPKEDANWLQRLIWDLTGKYEIVHVEIKRYRDMKMHKCLAKYIEEYPTNNDRQGQIMKWRYEK